MLRVTQYAALFSSVMILVACGGGGGGGPIGSTPDQRFQPNPKPQNVQSPTQTKSKPKIKRAAKELFKLAGDAAASSPPNYERALEYYENAYKQDKNLTLALYNIGLVYELKGDEQQARRFYELAGNAGLGDGWVNLGLFALAQGDKAQAESLFNRALSVEPLNGQAHLNLALIDKDRGDSPQAMKRVRDALKDDSSNADAYDVLAQVYYKLGRFQLALLVTDAGLSDLNANHSGLWTTQGLILLKKDDIIKAIRSFRKAVELDDANFAARLNLGLITFNYRDYEQSYQLLSEALKLKPDHLQANLSLAVAARTLKRYDEARRGYEQVLNLSPNHPGALFNLTVLNQDYVEVSDQDYDQRRAVTKAAIAQYSKVLSLARAKSLRTKVARRIEEAKVLLEAIDVEQEEAAAEVEAARQEQQAAPAQEPASAPAPAAP